MYSSRTEVISYCEQRSIITDMSSDGLVKSLIWKLLANLVKHNGVCTYIYNFTENYCLQACLPAYLSVFCLSVCLPACMPAACVCVCQSTCPCLSVCFSSHLQFTETINITYLWGFSKSLIKKRESESKQFLTWKPFFQVTN